MVMKVYFFDLYVNSNDLVQGMQILLIMTIHYSPVNVLTCVLLQVSVNTIISPLGLFSENSNSKATIVASFDTGLTRQ